MYLSTYSVYLIELNVVIYICRLYRVSVCRLINRLTVFRDEIDL